MRSTTGTVTRCRSTGRARHGWPGHIDGTTVSASGISTVAHLDEALRHCDAALVGTALMAAADPGKALKELVW